VTRTEEEAPRAVIQRDHGGMSPKRSGPGPEEEQELAREERREARDELHNRADDNLVEEDNGELTNEEILELDQTELEELGLTLDDPHQPDEG
jgi:hypothetical protein